MVSWILYGGEIFETRSKSIEEWELHVRKTPWPYGPILDPVVLLWRTRLAFQSRVRRAFGEFVARLTDLLA